MPPPAPPRFATTGPSPLEMQKIVSLYQAGKHADVEAQAQALTTRFPRHGFAWAILAAALRAQGRNGQALAPLEKAAALAPGDPKLQFNLGNVLRDLGQSEQAMQRYRQALRLQPDFPEASYQLGNLQQDLGRHAEAEQNYRRVLKSVPGHAKAHANLALSMQETGRLEEARASLARAIALEPGNTALHFNLADLLHDMGRLAEAEEACHKALLLDPDLAPAHSHLGTILQDQGRLQEALACYDAALRLQPADLVASSSRLFCLNYLPGTDAGHCLAQAQKFGELAARRAGPAFSAWRCPADAQRLRVGLVSADLREHPVGYFLESVLSQIDSRRIELVAFPAQAGGDALTQRIRPHFAQWQPLAGLDDEAAAQLVHTTAPHVLIDLSGHTAHNRLTLFARRPAPVQATWLGYFATTGVAAIDYLLADAWSLPPALEGGFTEKIWRLPDTRLCFTPPAAAPEVGPLPAGTAGPITFGCFNNLSKINDDVVALWCRVLDAVPGSRLLLKAKQYRDASVVDAVRERFVRRGLEAGRLEIEGPSPRSNYLAAYHRVDIGLDPFPFPGGTTTVESLWMGVPVLTLSGDTFVSRQGVGILTNAGLPEWVAADAGDCVARAVRHAADLPALAALRGGLRAQLLASPLFDAPRFARALEDALHGMWARHVKSAQAPAA